jgi:diaminopimelate epimerase
MYKIPFIKMQGIGNDYVYIDCFENKVEEPEKLAITVSDRSFGIGSNGLILICPSDVADAKMRMFNADGSEGTMCGNGIRCVGKYIAEKFGKNMLDIETLSGIKHLQVELLNEKKAFVTVDMGKAVLEAKNVPIISNEDKIINSSLVFDNTEYKVTALSMGNPHAVVFHSNIASLLLSEIGPMFEKSSLFPNSVNTEFAQIVKRNEFKMRVWERGSAETLACGTGACAVAVAACLNGVADYNSEITVHLLGGDLFITCDSNLNVVMKGEAEMVFEGVYYF